MTLTQLGHIFRYLWIFLKHILVMTREEHAEIPFDFIAESCKGVQPSRQVRDQAAWIILHKTSMNVGAVRTQDRQPFCGVHRHRL